MIVGIIGGGASGMTAALRAVLEPIGGLDWVKPGMRVGIKANLVTFQKPESAATTHPALLCALVNLLKEHGIKVVGACSERNIIEKKAEGGRIIKTTEFNFVKFREY